MRVSIVSALGGRLVGVALALALCACEGATFGENAPGQDTWLEAGALAVDPTTDTTFVMSVGPIPPTTTVPQPKQIKRLNAVQSDGTALSVLELDGRTDVRVTLHEAVGDCLFAHAGVLVMSQEAGADRLELLSSGQLTPLNQRQTASRYHGTRMSPSRRWVAVADNKDQATPIHLIDTEDLSATPVQHGAQWLEAMWLNKADHLAAILFDAQLFTQKPKPARVVVWDVKKVQDAGFPKDVNGAWAQTL